MAQTIYRQQVPGATANAPASVQVLPVPNVTPIGQTLLQQASEAGRTAIKGLVDAENIKQKTLIEQAYLEGRNAMLVWAQDYKRANQGSDALEAQKAYEAQWSTISEQLNQKYGTRIWGTNALAFRKAMEQGRLMSLYDGGQYQDQQTRVFYHNQDIAEAAQLLQEISANPGDLQRTQFLLSNYEQNWRMRNPGMDPGKVMIDLRGQAAEQQLNALEARGDYEGAKRAMTFFGGSPDYGIGSLAIKYESGGNAGDVTKDWGGIKSYGLFQFTTRNGKGTANDFVKQLKQTNPKLYEALGGGKNKVGTPDFDANFRAVANGPLREEMIEAQRNFLSKAYLVPTDKMLQGSGLEKFSNSRAFQEVVTSTAIQHGPTGANKILRQAANAIDPSLSQDEQLRQFISHVYSLRGAPSQFASARREKGEAYYQSIVNRFRREQADALALVGQTVNGNEPTHLPEAKGVQVQPQAQKPTPSPSSPSASENSSWLLPGAKPTGQPIPSQTTIRSSFYSSAQPQPTVQGRTVPVFMGGGSLSPEKFQQHALKIQKLEDQAHVGAILQQFAGSTASIAEGIRLLSTQEGQQNLGVNGALAQSIISKLNSEYGNLKRVEDDQAVNRTYMAFANTPKEGIQYLSTSIGIHRLGLTAEQAKTTREMLNAQISQNQAIQKQRREDIEKGIYTEAVNMMYGTNGQQRDPVRAIQLVQNSDLDGETKRKIVNAIQNDTVDHDNPAFVNDLKTRIVKGEYIPESYIARGNLTGDISRKTTEEIRKMKEIIEGPRGEIIKAAFKTIDEAFRKSIMGDGTPEQADAHYRASHALIQLIDEWDKKNLDITPMLDPNSKAYILPSIIKANQLSMQEAIDAMLSQIRRESDTEQRNLQDIQQRGEKIAQEQKTPQVQPSPQGQQTTQAKQGQQATQEPKIPSRVDPNTGRIRTPKEVLDLYYRR